jgi:hypothetical protein
MGAAIVRQGQGGQTPATGANTGEFLRLGQARDLYGDQGFP